MDSIRATINCSTFLYVIYGKQKVLRRFIINSIFYQYFSQRVIQFLHKIWTGPGKILQFSTCAERFNQSWLTIPIRGRCWKRNFESASYIVLLLLFSRQLFAMETVLVRRWSYADERSVNFNESVFPAHFVLDVLQQTFISIFITGHSQKGTYENIILAFD